MTMKVMQLVISVEVESENY